MIYCLQWVICEDVMKFNNLSIFLDLSEILSKCDLCLIVVWSIMPWSVDIDYILSLQILANV